jgi:lipoprotein-releasing system permease protein
MAGWTARAPLSACPWRERCSPCRKGVTRIEIKLDDLNAADATALRIRALTGLDAVPWTDGAEQLMEALNAQAQTGYFLKTFALITIVIGVASALMLSTYRRRPEIGIMRAMGAGREFRRLSSLSRKGR